MRCAGLESVWMVSDGGIPNSLFVILCSMIMVSANETFKKILNPTGEMNISAYFASGAMAGALAGVLTNPLDVAKTRLQTQMLLVQEDPSVRPRVAPAPATASFASRAELQVFALCLSLFSFFAYYVAWLFIPSVLLVPDVRSYRREEWLSLFRLPARLTTQWLRLYVLYASIHPHRRLLGSAMHLISLGCFLSWWSRKQSAVNQRCVCNTVVFWTRWCKFERRRA